MSQLHSGGCVANGIHAGDAGLIAFVHQQPFTVQRRGQSFGKQTVEIRPAANGAQHLLAGDGQLLVLLLQMDAKSARCLLHRLHHGGGQHPHALLFQDLRQILSQLTIQLGQQVGHTLHQRYLTAEMTVERGKFHADNAAADNDDGLIRCVRALQQLVGGHNAGQLQSGNGRPDIHRAGGGQNALRGIPCHRAVRTGDIHLTGGGDLRRTLDNVHLCALQQRVDARAQLLADAALESEHFTDVVGKTAVNAYAGAVHGIVIDLRGVEQRLGRDAAPVQAGAAHLPALHDGGMQPQLGGAQRGGVPTGACANDDQLIVRHRSSSCVFRCFVRG